MPLARLELHVLLATLLRRFPALAPAQRIADATVWPLLAGACHPATDPSAAITAAGFDVTTVRRLRFP